MVRPAEVASIVTEPTSSPVIVLVATPATAVSVPVPLTLPAPEPCRRRRRWSCRGDGVSGGVLDRRGQDAFAAGGEVGGRAGQRDLVGGAVDNRECTEGARGQSRRRGFHRYRADEAAGHRLGDDALEAVASPVPATLPAPDACREPTTVELSEVTVLPAASLIVAVRTRFPPEVRFVVEPLSTI